MTVYALIFGICLILIVLSLISMVFVCGADNHTDNQPELITYNQNGYHSDRSGYQTGKFSKNNTYNGRN